jgi:hypothetical protein
LASLERWRKPLSGFISTGDAFCSYNPTNGLGMSAAAVSAQTLRDLLKRKNTDGLELTKRFHREQARIQRGLWEIAIGNDFRFPHTEGKRTRTTRLITWYRDLVTRTTRDSVVQERVREVAAMMMPVSALWAPSIVWRVIRSELNRMRHRRRKPRAIPPMPPPMPEVSTR